MEKIRLLDAFAGIGGFHLGVKQACEELGIDFKCVGAIEFDKRARETYKNNFPNTEMFDKYSGDITKIPIDELPDHNILTGGFPCQPFSMAGKAYKNNMRVVNSDSRSMLFTNLIDILRKKQPTYFLFENVKGILNLRNNDNKKIIDIIKNYINNVGYNVLIKVISPHEVSIPQKRERIFFIGVKKPNVVKDFCLLNNNTTLLNFLDKDVDDKYYLKNIKIWKGIGKIRKDTRLNMLWESFWLRKKNNLHNLSYTNTVLAAEINGDTPSGRSRQTNRVYHNCGLSPTLTTVDKRIVYDGIDFRYLTEKEYARLQGFPNNFILNDKNSYSQFGNAVCIPVVQEIVKRIF